MDLFYVELRKGLKVMIRALLLGLLLVFSSPVFAASMSSGTGFFINGDGYLVTAHHVTDDATMLLVRYNGKLYRAEVIATNKEFDTSIIHIKVKGNKYFHLGRYYNGQKIVVVGYPAPQYFGTYIHTFYGQVMLNPPFDCDTSDVDIFGDYITACAGNSGGPVLDRNTNQVIGVLNSGYWPYSCYDLCSQHSGMMPTTGVRILAHATGVKYYDGQEKGFTLYKEAVVLILAFNNDEV